MRFAALAIPLMLGPGSAARAAEPDTYIFDVLALQPYKGNFARLVKGDAIPDWVKAIAVQGAGTAGPSRIVDVGGTPYRLDRVCKVDACPGNTLDVLWAPRGQRVWAALVEGDKPAVMLGAPKGAQARALATATVAPAPSETPAAATSLAAAPAPTPATPAPAAPSASAGAGSDPYIFDVLALQPYKGNFARLVKRKGTPDWVKAIAVQGAGTAGPSRTVDVAGTPYRLDRVCKVGACATDRLDVLWGPHGQHVWAALVEGGKPPVMLGDPKGAQAHALEAEAGAAASSAAPVAAASVAATSPSAPTAPAPALPAAPTGVEPDPYIFDVLALQPYKGNFARLVRGKGLPDWVQAISVQGAGTAGPSRNVDVAGTPYRLDLVCKVGACATDRLGVLWGPRGSKVWAALVENGKPPVMLGDPKGEQAEALAGAAGLRPAPGGAAPAPSDSK